MFSITGEYEPASSSAAGSTSAGGGSNQREEPLLEGCVAVQSEGSGDEGDNLNHLKSNWECLKIQRLEIKVQADEAWKCMFCKK